MSSEQIHVGVLRKLADGSFDGKLTRVYEDHGCPEVWKMLTESVCMAQWLAPGVIELHQGGAVKIDFEDSGVKIASTVLEVEPQRTLVYSWSSGDEPERRLGWSLKAVGENTELTLQVHIPQGEDAARACGGFEGHLEMLGAALEGVPMKFPFDLFVQARKAYNEQLAAA